MTEKDLNRNVRIGVIGVGQIGKYHLNNYQGIEAAEVLP